MGVGGGEGPGCVYVWGIHIQSFPYFEQVNPLLGIWNRSTGQQIKDLPTEMFYQSTVYNRKKKKKWTQPEHPTRISGEINYDSVEWNLGKILKPLFLKILINVGHGP